MTLGLLHARRLGYVVRSHLDDPREFVETWDAVTEAELTPWYRETVEEDRARLHEIEALRNGLESVPPADSPAGIPAAMTVACPHDPDAYRAYIANRSCLKLQREVRADSTLVDRSFEIARDCGRPPTPGPNRDQLLQLLIDSYTAA